MRILPFMVTLVLAACLSAAAAIDTNQLREGDLLFQESYGRQARALYLATKSRYSHVGVAFKHKGYWWVYEAVGPVKSTMLDEFVGNGVGDHVVVKRLKPKYHRLLTPKKIAYAKRVVANRYLGKPYDPFFGWSNRRIYCSELAWKMYRDTLGIKVAKLEKMRDFDLSDPFVKRLLKERYGKKVPLNETVISVVGLMNSPKLYTVMTTEAQ